MAEPTKLEALTAQLNAATAALEKIQSDLDNGVIQLEHTGLLHINMAKQTLISATQLAAIAANPKAADQLLPEQLATLARLVEEETFDNLNYNDCALVENLKMCREFSESFGRYLEGGSADIAPVTAACIAMSDALPKNTTEPHTPMPEIMAAISHVNLRELQAVAGLVGKVITTAGISDDIKRDLISKQTLLEKVVAVLQLSAMPVDKLNPNDIARLHGSESDLRYGLSAISASFESTIEGIPESVLKKTFEYDPPDDGTPLKEDFIRVMKSACSTAAKMIETPQVQKTIAQINVQHSEQKHVA
jgi:hypothetical protein